MKFLLELVTCYGSSSTDQSVTQQPLEESRSLVGSRTRRRVGRKRGMRSVGGGSDWSPSLSSISEHSVPVPVAERNDQPRQPASVGFSRNLKRKVGSFTHRDQAPSHLDDSRRASISATIPTFSPTAFLF